MKGDPLFVQETIMHRDLQKTVADRFLAIATKLEPVAVDQAVGDVVLCSATVMFDGVPVVSFNTLPMHLAVRALADAFEFILPRLVLSSVVEVRMMPARTRLPLDWMKP